MNTVVLKYGGSSVADIEKINAVADRIIEKKKVCERIVTVVSAMGKTTNKLIALAKDISSSPVKREMDMLLSTGEQMTISLLAMALNEKGYKAISLTGFQAGVKTTGVHMKNRIDDIHIDRVKNYLDDDYIVIVAGFQGINSTGDITTLGRGGSDTSAVALAAKLNCPCEIYTDVEGIFTVDPRLHPKAYKLDELTYEETMEMANLGAKVIEPRSVELAWKFNVPLYIGLNTGKVLGTYIRNEVDKVEKNIINNISLLDDILLVNMIFEKGEEKTSIVFEELAKSNVNIDVISQNIEESGQQYVSFTSTTDNMDVVEKILKNMGINFKFKDNVSKVSIIGDAMRNQPGVAARVFGLFKDNKIEFYQVSTSEISISYIIESKDNKKIVKVLAKEFNL